MPASLWKLTHLTLARLTATLGVPHAATMSWRWCVWPERGAPKPWPMVCAPATGKTVDPAGAGVVVVVVVSPGAPTPPLWANARPVPNSAVASAITASAATTLLGVRPTGLSIPALTKLSAAYGVSWRARAESGATNQLVAIRPWGVNPFGSSVPPDAPGGLGPQLARHYSERAGG